MAGRARGEQVRADLWQQMRRHLDAVRCSDAGRLDPAAHAADSSRVRHDVVAGSGGECLDHGLRSIEVLPDLHRYGERSRDRRVAGVIVVTDRLLEPDNAFSFEGVAFSAVDDHLVDDAVGRNTAERGEVGVDLGDLGALEVVDGDGVGAAQGTQVDVRCRRGSLGHLKKGNDVLAYMEYASN